MWARLVAVWGGDNRPLLVEHPARQELELSRRSGGQCMSAMGCRAHGGSICCVLSFMSKTCARVLPHSEPLCCGMCTALQLVRGQSESKQPCLVSGGPRRALTNPGAPSPPPHTHTRPAPRSRQGMSAPGAPTQHTCTASGPRACLSHFLGPRGSHGSFPRLIQGSARRSPCGQAFHGRPLEENHRLLAGPPPLNILTLYCMYFVCPIRTHTHCKSSNIV